MKKRVDIFSRSYVKRRCKLITRTNSSGQTCWPLKILPHWVEIRYQIWRSSLISMLLIFRDFCTNSNNIKGILAQIRQNDIWKFFRIEIKSEVAFLFQYFCNSTRFYEYTSNEKIAFFTLCNVESHTNQSYCASFFSCVIISNIPHF